MRRINADLFAPQNNKWEDGVTSVWDLLDGENELPVQDCLEAMPRWMWMAYELNISGEYLAPVKGAQGNYIVTIDSVVAYVGCTKDLRYRTATNSVIRFAKTQPGFELLWMPGGNFKTENLLRKYLYPEWNGTQLRKFRPFHDCGTTMTSGAYAHCTIRYQSTIHLDKRTLWDIAA